MPKPVGKWVWPVQYSKVTGNFTLEAMVFHRAARNGKPVAAVVFTVTDEHSNSVSYTVTGMTVSGVSGDQATVLVYAASVNVSTLTQGDVLTCNFKAYPWVGGASQVLDSNSGVTQPSVKLSDLQLFNDKDGTYGGGFAVVDPVNGGSWSSGHAYVYATQADAETAYGTSTANSYQYIGDAATAIKDYNNNHASPTHNDPGGGTILLCNASHTYNGDVPASALGAQKTWLTVTRLSTVTRAQAAITGGGGTIKCTKLHLYDIYLNSATNRCIRGTNTTDSIWVDSCDINLTSDGLFSWLCAYATHNSVTALQYGFRSGGDKLPCALTRGNAGPAGSVECDLYCVVGNSNVTGSAGNGFKETGNAVGQDTSDGFIFAFNITKGAIQAFLRGPVATTTTGFAIVQNVFEKKSGASGTSADAEVGADASYCTIDHGIIWHNTVVGERFNVGYNDQGTTFYLKTNWSEVGNVARNRNFKDDTFGTQNANRTGSWSIGYGVGVFANQYAGSVARATYDGLWTIWGSACVFVNDQSYAGTIGAGGTDAAGGGDYHLTGASPALNLIPSGGAVLPYDIEGTARRNDGTGAAGAYEYTP